MKNPMKVAGIAVAVLLAAGVIFVLYTCFTGTGVPYYAQIDNSRVKPTESIGGVFNFEGSLPYTYTLPACDENGREKEISFGTSRELTEDAFVRLVLVPIRGVVSWEEVQYNELPPAVRDRYAV